MSHSFPFLTNIFIISYLSIYIITLVKQNLYITDIIVSLMYQDSTLIPALKKYEWRLCTSSYHNGTMWLANKANRVIKEHKLHQKVYLI